MASGESERSWRGALMARVFGLTLVFGGIGVFVIGIGLAIFGGSGNPHGETATAMGKVVANGRMPKCIDTAAFSADGRTFHVYIETKAVGGQIGGNALGVRAACNPKPIGTQVKVAFAAQNPNLATVESGNHRLTWVLFSLFGLVLALVGAVINP